MSKLGKDHKFWTSRNWLVSRIIIKELKRVFPMYLKGKLLDLGCGEKPLEGYIRPYVTEYVGLDHAGSMHDRSKVDMLGTAYEISAKAEYFDTIISTAVLEHLEEPLDAIKEAYRVLKRGGFAIYTIPFFWHLHEYPRDFYRFTQYGIRHLFGKGGFEIVELKPLAGYWVTFGQETVYYLWRFRRGWKANPMRWIVPPLCILIQWVCYLLGRFDHSHEFSWMYLVVVKKN